MQDITNRVDAITGAPLSATTVQQIVNRQLGTTTTSLRLQVCDTQLNPLPVSVGNPNDPSDITDLVDQSQTCSVTHDTAQPVHRTFTFSMRDQKDIPGRAARLSAAGLPSFPIDPNQNLLRLWYRMTAGGHTLDVSLGYYVPVMPKRDISPGSMTYDFTCQDLTSLVAQTRFMSDWAVLPSTTGGYVGAMTAMLASGAIPKSFGGTGMTPAGQDDAGPEVPASLIQISQVGNITIPVAYLFAFNSDRVAALNQLAGGFNFYPLWNAPSDGSFRSSQMPYYGAGLPAYGWDYSPMPGVSIVEIPISQTFSNQLGNPNIVRVVSAGTSSGAGAFSSTQINTNPDSVVSTVNRTSLSGGPRAVVYCEDNPQIQDAQVCTLRAQILLQQGAMLAETVTMSSLPNPLHEDHDLLMFNVTQADGTTVIPSSSQSLFEEQSWTMDLTPQGRHVHNCLRVVPI